MFELNTIVHKNLFEIKHWKWMAHLVHGYTITCKCRSCSLKDANFCARNITCKSVFDYELSFAKRHIISPHNIRKPLWRENFHNLTQVTEIMLLLDNGACAIFYQSKPTHFTECSSVLRGWVWQGVTLCREVFTAQAQKYSRFNTRWVLSTAILAFCQLPHSIILTRF